MIATNIPTVERGESMHDASFFELVFTDDSSITEKETNWSSFSGERVVTLLGKKKTVMVCNHPVKTIKITHNGLETGFYVPEGCEVYQAIRSRTSVGEAGSSKVVGRLVGIIKGDKVIEEHFLDGISGEVTGVRDSQ